MSASEHRTNPAQLLRVLAGQVASRRLIVPPGSDTQKMTEGYQDFMGARSPTRKSATLPSTPDTIHAST